MTIEEILQYYSDLLIIQYNDKPKAKATIEALIKLFIANNIILDILNGYNIDTAIGKQLDILGKYIGANRFYKGTLFDKTYFAFIGYDGIEYPLTNGFADYTDFYTKEGEFLSYSDILSGSNALSDSDYRLLLKLKIFQNNIDHSVTGINNALLEIFGLSVYMVDNYDMSMTYFIPAEKTALILAAIEKDILLRPMAVGIKLLPDKTFFSFADYTEIDSPRTNGFSDYTDFSTKEGEFLSYNDILN